LAATFTTHEQQQQQPKQNYNCFQLCNWNKYTISILIEQIIWSFSSKFFSGCFLVVSSILFQKNSTASTISFEFHIHFLWVLKFKNPFETIHFPGLWLYPEFCTQQESLPFFRSLCLIAVTKIPSQDSTKMNANFRTYTKSHNKESPIEEENQQKHDVSLNFSSHHPSMTFFESTLDGSVLTSSVHSSL
jgi:hypothetical protein